VIVVDASATVEMLALTPAGKRCLEHAARGQPAVVPANFDAEVYAALRRTYLERRIDLPSLRALVDQLRGFDAERVALTQYLSGVTQLVDVLGAHDVFYVLLAIGRACPLLTCDLRLARAAARLGVEVIAVDRARPA
jgi:predicted nucleic acid-binding protein